jgi:glycosyltransferase involved in cell wall biosynthesis
MILPRRYGGLCLPMNEALMSGLPVVMTDVSPNSVVLPKELLSTAVHSRVFQARTQVDVFNADPKSLGQKLDWLARMPSSELSRMKSTAYDLAYETFSPEVLRPKYVTMLST